MKDLGGFTNRLDVEGRAAGNLMKIFLKNTFLATVVQAILVGVTLLVVYLFHLPQETWLMVWVRIYAPPILLVMMLFMLFTSIRNLGIALALGFLLGALLYGAIFSFTLRLYRSYKASQQVSINLSHETNSPAKTIE